MYSLRSQYLDLIDAFYRKGSEQNLLSTRPEYWPIVRIQLSYAGHLKFAGKDLGNVVLKDVQRFTCAKFFDLIKGFFKKWRYDTKLLAELNGKVLLVGFNNHSSPVDGNVYIHPVKKVLDDLRIENDCLFLRNGAHDILENSLSRYLYFLVSFYRERYYLLEHSKRVDIYKQIIKEIKENFVLKEFDPSSIDRVANTVVSLMVESRIYENAFSEFLKKLRPQLIWTYCYYDYRMISLNLAANELRIKTIEYQHSMQGDRHFAYSHWPNIDQMKNFFPSGFWLWSETDKKQIEKNFNGNTFKPLTITGGNIRLALEQAKLDNKVPIDLQANGILVTLQGMWIPEFVEVAIEKNLEFKWYFRLHPRYAGDKLKLEKLKAKFPSIVEVDLANTLSLYQLFKIVSFNLTAFSGAALEAYYCGVQNIIVSDEGYHSYKEYIDSGVFHYAFDYDSLTQCLKIRNKTEIGPVYPDIQSVKRNIKMLLG